MERIQKDYGAVIMHNGRIFAVEGACTSEGEIFKDWDAFTTGEGICYISEYGLEEIDEELTDLQARYENGEMTDEEYEIAREKAILDIAETRQTIIDQVRDAWGEDYMLTDAQVEYLAIDVFGLADWAYICTYLAENFEMEDIILENYDNMFSKFQIEAVENDMTPKEYADRQLSYGELVELDKEFDSAFIVDEDCLDDWSDKGLGANARITYIEERRTGVIDGPEQFDCPPQFVRK